MTQVLATQGAGLGIGYFLGGIGAGVNLQGGQTIMNNAGYGVPGASGHGGQSGVQGGYGVQPPMGQGGVRPYQGTESHMGANTSLPLDQRLEFSSKIQLCGIKFIAKKDPRETLAYNFAMTEGNPKDITAGENIIDSRLSMVDLSKYLKPCPVKTRTIRLQTWPSLVLSSPGVSSRDQDSNHSPRVLGSEASVQPHLLDSCRGSSSEEELGSGDDSGKLKRKLEKTENGPGLGDHNIQKIYSGVDYPKISDTEGADDHDEETTEPDIDINNSTSSMEGCTDDQPKNQVACTPTPKVYACSSCSKTFSSHLALGGHKSSHNKFMMVIENAIDHRRKETGKIAASSEKIAATMQESIGDDRTQSAPEILGFDLNELPKEEEEPSPKC